MRNAAKPMAESRNGPAEALATARVTTGFASAPSVVARRDDDNRHDHARHARYGTRERDPRELCRAANRRCPHSRAQLRIVPAKCRNTKPASSIANAPMRLFHWLSSAQSVHA